MQGKKKKMLALALVLSLVASVSPLTASAEQVQGDENSECVCETYCTTENVNTDCALCKKGDLTVCKGAEISSTSDILKTAEEELGYVIVDNANNGAYEIKNEDGERGLRLKDGADITVSMKQDVDNVPQIKLEDKSNPNAKAKLTLNGVIINKTPNWGSAIEVKDETTLTLVLPYNEDSPIVNEVTGGDGGAGIGVSTTGTLIIECAEHPDGNCNEKCGYLKACGKIFMGRLGVLGSGAGIGGGAGVGSNNTCGTITIKGGKVYAEGAKDSAGIGNNWLNQEVPDPKNPITISGGLVEAKGGENGAGIGGGKGTWGKNVIISGGYVKAEGGDNANGIGDGAESKGNSTFSTGTNGNAVIFTDDIAATTDTSALSGVIFEGTNGKVYGTTVAPKVSFEVSNGSTLTIPQDTTLVIPEGVTLTNNGTIAGDGSLICIGECKNNGAINGFPKKSKITLEFDKEKYQYNDTATITAKISPDTTRTSTASARADVPKNKIVFYLENSRGKNQFDERVIDSTTKEFKIQLSADNGFVPGNNIISAEYGGNQIGFDPSTSNSISINIQESNPSDDTAGDAANPFINGNVFFPSAPPVSTSNSNTITPNAVTTGDQSAENVNAFEFADDNEEASTTYSESNNPAESGGEQNSDAETNAVINQNDSDLPPKTGNGGSVTLIALALVSLVGIGGISLYNNKKKR